MSLRRSLCLCTLACVLFASLVASAQPASKSLRKGRKHFENLDFAKAVATLEAVVDAEDLSGSQRLLALELIAISHLSLGHNDKARATFAKLLMLRPDYELTSHDGSPKVEEVFEEIRTTLKEREAAENSSEGTSGKDGEGASNDPPDEAKDNKDNKAEPPESIKAKAPSLQLELAGNAKPGASYEIVVLVKGPEPVEVVAFWLAHKQGRFERTPLRRVEKGRWRASIGVPFDAEAALSLYVDALGPAGERLARLGSPREPETIPLAGKGAAKSSTPWYKHWAVWAGIGAVVVGGTAAIYLAPEEEIREGNLPPGRVTLTP